MPVPACSFCLSAGTRDKWQQSSAVLGTMYSMHTKHFVVHVVHKRGGKRQHAMDARTAVHCDVTTLPSTYLVMGALLSIRAARSMALVFGWLAPFDYHACIMIDPTPGPHAVVRLELLQCWHYWHTCCWVHEMWAWL
jgi:hypothetical protein